MNKSATMQIKPQDATELALGKETNQAGPERLPKCVTPSPSKAFRGPFPNGEKQAVSKPQWSIQAAGSDRVDPRGLWGWQSYTNATSSVQRELAHVSGQRASLGTAPDQQFNPTIAAARDPRLGPELRTVCAEF